MALLLKSTEAHGAREAALEALKARKAADGSAEIDWDDEKEQLCAATTLRRSRKAAARVAECGSQRS
jgi:hypothetical protein